MKKLTFLFSLIMILLAACGSEPISVADIQATQEAQATAFVVTQTSVAGSVLDRVRAVAPDGSVVDDIQPGRDHSSEINYEYDSLPPTGGTHNPTWQKCGIYADPIRAQYVLHSMEHGAVWITYQEDLPAADVDKLERAANSVTSTILSPYPNLRSPVVLTAWAVQLEVDSADDPRIQEFINNFARGPQTPELEANCASGIQTMDG